jgi:HSP20 family protein
MTQIVRWDPFGEFSSLRRAMDRLFDDFAPSRAWRTTEANELTFPVDVSETENEIVVKAVLPGVKPEDVDISVSEGVLTIKGETRSEQKTEKENYYRQEIRYGAFSRSIPMPTRVNHEQAGADFADGVLTVRLPKAEEVRPRSIKVRARGEQPELAASGAGNSNQS